ncbi:MAG: phasin family protein [Spirulina sp.]
MNIIQKAFYFGVGVASYAGEKAGEQLQQLQVQAQKLADEMVKRGELTAEEANNFVDDLVQKAQQSIVEGESPQENREPRRIEIVEEDEPSEEESKTTEDVEQLRSQVESLQEELRRLQNE